MSARAELRQLTSKQQILAQKYELEQRITGFNKELKESQNLMQCLTGLQSKMMSVGEDLYACQLVTVTKGINIIQEQISFSQDVINGYSQLIKIIEIEFETSQLVEQLPEDISEKILRRLEELMVIQTKREELSLLFDPQQIMPQLYFK